MIIGDRKKFAFDLKKISDKDHLSQLKIFVDGKNICEWEDKETGQIRTIQWNLDELITFLHDTEAFLYHDDPFPINTVGECASELENNARDFESANEDEMDDYYDRLNDWVYNHSWNHARAGAIVPDVLFRNVNGDMEVSWWNDDEEVEFTNRYGYTIVPAEIYRNLIEQLFSNYNTMWL